MNFSTVAIHPNTLRSGLSVALAIGALAVLSTRAHAAEFDPITVSAPTVETMGYDFALEGPIEKTTVTARIAVDAQTLTMDSGVTLLQDRVLEAANQACSAADPFTLDDDTCVREAVRAAQPQVDAAIARARNSNAMG
jgi:UrcA family protein